MKLHITMKTIIVFLEAKRYSGFEGAGVLLPYSEVYNSSKRPGSLMLIFHVADPKLYSIIALSHLIAPPNEF